MVLAFNAAKSVAEMIAGKLKSEDFVQRFLPDRKFVSVVNPEDNLV